MYVTCPKCGHSPLPADQASPAACGGCGVILAKVGERPARAARPVEADAGEDRITLLQRLLEVPERVDPLHFWARVATWLAFTAWGAVLVAQDYRVGEIGQSFIHRPLLIFHEAGHVIFGVFGEWMMYFGGTLGQLVMPAVMGGALLWKNRDPFGASLGLWLLGVSLLDVAPYVYDALHPQLMLLSGTTGEEGGHDWIWLLSVSGKLAKAQVFGALIHKLGAVVVLVGLAWGAWVLCRQHANLGD